MVTPVEQEFPFAFSNLDAKLLARRWPGQRSCTQIDEGKGIPGRLLAQEGGGRRRGGGKPHGGLEQEFVNGMIADAAKRVFGVAEVCE